MKQRVVLSKSSRILWDGSALKDARFVLFALSSLLGFLAIYIPFYYTQQWARDQLDVAPDLAFYSVSIMNAGSVAGRLVQLQLASYTGAMTGILFSSIISAVVCYCWIAVKSTTGLIIFTLFYGYSSGAWLALNPVVIANITPRADLIGTRMGMAFMIMAPAALIGNPVAGVLLGHHRPNYLHLQLFAAVAMTAAAGGMAVVLILQRLQTKTWKV